MGLLDQVLDLINKYGPALSVLAICYYRDRVLEAKNKETVANLKAKLLQNGIDVDKEDAGLSPGAIIDKYAKSKSPNS